MQDYNRALKYIVCNSHCEKDSTSKFIERTRRQRSFIKHLLDLESPSGTDQKLVQNDYLNKKLNFQKHIAWLVNF